MASRASKIAVEDSIAEFNKTRHRNSGTTGSESENANGKPKPPKKKPKKAKSVYARSVMTTMTNKVSTSESEILASRYLGVSAPWSKKRIRGTTRTEINFVLKTN